VATQACGPDGGIAVAERVKDSIDIKGTAEDIFEVAADYASYPEWQDQVKKVDVLETDEDGYGTVVHYEIDAVLKKLSYTLDYDYSGWPKHFAWTLRDGDLKSLDGKYSFDEFDDVTEVTYEIAIEPGFKIPSVLRRQGERQIVSTALKGLKKRVESR
jgi:ribosome-associated toxin RatA of RatAB toxin-antitoxin module